MQNHNAQADIFSPALGLAEQIADHVQKQIVSGVLEPGQRISEASITRDLDVSRGPVRESMRILVRRHLVELPPRKGARVTEFGLNDINSLYDLQKSLIDLLISKVFSCWKPDDLERFVVLQNQLSKAAQNEDALELIELSYHFQLTACAVVGNAYLTAAITDLQPSFSRAYFRAMNAGTEEMQSLLDFIRNLITHIVDDDLSKCRQLVEKYTEHQRRVALSTYKA